MSGKPRQFERFVFSPSAPIGVNGPDGALLNACDEMRVRFLGDFETAQCHVSVYRTYSKLSGHIVYAVESVHKKDGRAYVRFGNREQARNLISTYRISKGEAPAL